MRLYHAQCPATQARVQPQNINDNDMKKFALAVTLAFASFGAAQAQEQAQVPAPAPAPVQDAAPAPAPAPTFVQVDPAGKPLRFVIGAGLTFGGDKLATAYYTDDTEEDIRAGGMLALLAGLDYRVSPQFSIQGTIGYHVDNSTASNGDMTFSRVPLELLGYYHVNEQVRVGGGIRHVTSTEFSSSGASDIGDFEFDDSTGAVAEIEYMYSRQLGVKLRWANDKFKEKRSGASAKGDHVGLLVNFYF